MLSVVRDGKTVVLHPEVGNAAEAGWPSREPTSRRVSR